MLSQQIIVSWMPMMKKILSPGKCPIDEEGHFLETDIPVRRSGDYTTRTAKEVKYMDVSPMQVISVAAL